MKEFSFIHCGDIHLGCTPLHLQERYDDFFLSFRSVIDYAISNNCKYVLVSGDFFHLKVVNSKTLTKVVDILEYAKENNIKVIAIEGNHDCPFYVDEYSWLTFLKSKGYIILLQHKIENGTLYITENSIYEDENIRVIGIGFLGSSTETYLKDLNKKIEKKDKYTILMLHTSLTRFGTEEMGIVSYEVLKPLKDVVDYIALGHIHTKYIVDSFCYNPGALENIRITDAKKENSKGFFHGIINENGSVIKYCNSKVRLTYNETIEVQGDEIEKVNTDIKKSLEKLVLEKNSILEISLYGHTSFNPLLLRINEIRDEIKKEKELLYVEIANYINIINKKEDNEEIDIANIEKNVIKEYILNNFPLEEANCLVDDIVNLKNKISNEEDKTTIIEGLIKAEESNETN